MSRLLKFSGESLIGSIPSGYGETATIPRAAIALRRSFVDQFIRFSRAFKKGIVTDDQPVIVRHQWYHVIGMREATAVPVCTEKTNARNQLTGKNAASQRLGHWLSAQEPCESPANECGRSSDRSGTAEIEKFRCAVGRRWQAT
jgi:hypothetical protein